MTYTERRRKINRSAALAILLSLIFGLALPILALQEAPEPQHPLATELGGRAVENLTKRGGQSTYPYSIAYRFPYSRNRLVEQLRSRLKAPEWSEWTDKMVFWGPNGDQIVVGLDTEADCTAYFHWGMHGPSLLVGESVLRWIGF